MTFRKAPVPHCCAALAALALVGACDRDAARAPERAQSDRDEREGAASDQSRAGAPTPPDASAESAPAPKSGDNGGASEAPPAPAPKLVTIDDIDFLQPVAFEEVAEGLRARPRDEEPANFLAFLLPDGAYAENYRNFAQFIAGMGQEVLVIDNLPTDGLDGFHDPDRCTLMGGVGESARAVFEYGYARRDSVDGVILASFKLEPDERYKKKWPIALVAGGRDQIVTEKDMQQFTQFPAQTYLITIAEANRNQYYDDRRFERDGEALVPDHQQRLILGDVVANMIDRLCLTRETERADAARKAAREAARAARENPPTPNADPD